MATNLQQVSPVHSVSVQGAYEPFDLQVARSQIMGHQQMNIFGYQTAITTASIPVWENAAAYVYPTSATTMTVVSTSASDDTSASILINGLDANYNQISETIFLNGTTGVTTVNSYFRINGLFLASPGTGQNTNVGTITVKQSTNTVAQINIGIGKSQATIFTVPNGYTFYVDQVEVNTSNSYTGSTIITYKVQAINNVSGVKSVILQQPFVSIYTITRPTDPFIYQQKTDLQWQLNTNTGTISAGAIIIGKLIKNNGQTA